MLDGVGCPQGVAWIQLAKQLLIYQLKGERKYHGGAMDGWMEGEKEFTSKKNMLNYVV